MAEDMTAVVKDIFVIFDCPRGVGTCLGNKCQVAVKGSAPWKNHGTDESPTLTPSYHCIRGCGWHGYIVDGKLIDAPAPELENLIAAISTLHICAHCKHPELQTVVMQAQAPGQVGLGVVVTEVRKP